MDNRVCHGDATQPLVAAMNHVDGWETPGEILGRLAAEHLNQQRRPVTWTDRLRAFIRRLVR